MATRHTFVGIFVLFLVHFYSVSCCSCLGKTLQQDFCDADFVIKVRLETKPLKEDGTDWEEDQDDFVSGIKHKILQIQKVLKADQKYEEANDKAYIHTAAYSSMCGAYLQSFTETEIEIVIFGSVSEDGRLHTDSCSRNMRWKSTPDRMKQALQTKLPQYCSECKIVSCTRRHNRIYSRQDQCKKGAALLGDSDTCIIRDLRCAYGAYCRKNKATNKCVWVDHRDDDDELDCALGFPVPEIEIPHLLPDQPEMIDVQIPRINLDLPENTELDDVNEADEGERR